MGFLSGVLQLLPIELCAELCPGILNFTEIDDPQVKINAYLTLEVLFASRRFDSDPNTNMALQQTLKKLLENPEIIHSVSFQETYQDEDGNEKQAKIQVDKKEENRIIAYVQALTQVLLNLATTDFSKQ